MKKLAFLMFILAFHLVQAQAPDPDFNDKAAFGDNRIYRKSAGFTESDDYSSTDVIYQRLIFTVGSGSKFHFRFDLFICKIHKRQYRPDSF